MNKSKTTALKILIAVFVITFAISAAHAICSDNGPKCGDYCATTSSTTTGGKCVGAKTTGVDCKAIGCETTCYGYWKSGHYVTAHNAYTGTSCEKKVNEPDYDDVCVDKNGNRNAVINPEVYYDKYGNQINCPSANLPEQVYAQVIPVSIPVHLTFGLLGTTSAASSLLNPVCGYPLYLSGIKGSNLGCEIPTKGYTMHNMTRYEYVWEMDFDAAVIASDPEKPVPMRIGQNLTLVNVLGIPFVTMFQGDKLWYTESFELG